MDSARDLFRCNRFSSRRARPEWPKVKVNIQLFLGHMACLVARIWLICVLPCAARGIPDVCKGERRRSTKEAMHNRSLQFRLGLNEARSLWRS